MKMFSLPTQMNMNASNAWMQSSSVFKLSVWDSVNTQFLLIHLIRSFYPNI